MITHQKLQLFGVLISDVITHQKLFRLLIKNGSFHFVAQTILKISRNLTTTVDTVKLASTNDKIKLLEMNRIRKIIL